MPERKVGYDGGHIADGSTDTIQGAGGMAPVQAPGRYLESEELHVECGPVRVPIRIQGISRSVFTLYCLMLNSLFLLAAFQ